VKEGEREIHSNVCRRIGAHKVVEEAERERKKEQERERARERDRERERKKEEKRSIVMYTTGSAHTTIRKKLQERERERERVLYICIPQDWSTRSCEGR